MSDATSSSGSNTPEKANLFDMVADQSEKKIQKNQKQPKFSFKDSFAESKGLAFGSKKVKANNIINPLESFGDLNGLNQLKFVAENEESKTEPKLNENKLD